MQKIFTLIFVFGSFFSSFAQATLWGGSADPKSTFTGGLAASGWTTEGLTSAVSDSAKNAIWEFTADGRGAKGAYWGSATRIASPSGATGAMIFNSDYLDTNGNSAAGGRNSGKAPAIHSGVLTSPTIDATTFPSAALSFYQYYRNFQSKTYVEVSTDNGVSWPTRIQLNSEIATNAATPNTNALATRKLIDITGVIKGQSAVKIRFLFEGDLYFWLIDDVTIISLPSNDLSISSAFYTPASYGQPKSQICGDLFVFNATVSNLGGSDQTNVVFKGEVLDIDKTTVLYADSITYPTFDINFDDSTISTLNTFDPGTLDYGKYYIRWSLYSPGVADFNTRDNSKIDSFEVTFDVFQKENGNTGGTRAAQGVAYSWGNQYRTSNCWGPNDKFEAGAVEYSVVANSGGTLNGFSNSIYMLKVNPDVLEDWSNFEAAGGITSPSITIIGLTSFDFTTQRNYELVSAPLLDINTSGPIQLEPNTRYFVMVEHPAEAGASNTWRFQAVSNLRANTQVLGNPLIVNNEWSNGFAGSQPLVRLRMNVITKTDDIPLPDNSLSIYPNPVVNNELQVTINLEDKKYANLTIFDLNGRVMSFENHKDFDNKIIPVNVSELSNGEYFIRVSNDHGTRTKKFVVAR